MKKTKLRFQKLNGVLNPAIRSQFDSMMNTIKEGEFLDVEFQTAKEGKNSKQLGYLYALVYPNMMAWFIDYGYDVLYYEQFKTFQAPVKTSIDSIDYFMKKMFDIFRNDGKQFSKSKATKEELCDYITYLDRFCIETFGQALPDAVKK